MNKYTSLKEIVEQLESCSYQCEAGPLENNIAFQSLQRMSTSPSKSVERRLEIQTGMSFQEYRDRLELDAEFLEDAHKLEPFFQIADAVLEMRLERKWSQTRLAQESSVNRITVSEIENALCNPTLKTLQKLADAFGTDLEIRFVERG